MALDPSISLGVQPPKIASPADLISLQGLVRQNQLGNMQMEEMVRARGEQDSLREVLRQPGSIDPNTGAVSLQGLTAAYGAAPDKAAAMAAQRTTTLKNVAELGKIDAETMKLKLETAGKQADIGKTAFEAASIAYDSAKSKGIPEQQAVAAGQQALLGKLDEMDRNGLAKLAGLTPEVLASVKSAPPDPAMWKSKAQTYTQFLTDLRATQGQAETGRHNLATEGQAGAALAETKRHNKETEVSAGQHYDAERGVMVDKNGKATPVTDASGAAVPQKLTEAQKKELSTIEAQQGTINGALKAVKETPDAFSMKRGLATLSGTIPESIASRTDSKEEREARAFVFNVVSKVINERAGAAQSKQELARLRSFLPAETDNASQVTDKLDAFNKYLGEQKTAWQKPQGASPAGGGGDLKASVEAAGVKYEPDKYEYRVTNGKVQRRLKNG
jgi:hypothetical protein